MPLPVNSHMNRKVKNARIRAVLNAKHALGHASMSGGVFLHYNAALQQFFLTFLLYAQTTSRGMETILKAKIFSQLSKSIRKTILPCLLEFISVRCVVWCFVESL